MLKPAGLEWAVGLALKIVIEYKMIDKIWHVKSKRSSVVSYFSEGLVQV